MKCGSGASSVHAACHCSALKEREGQSSWDDVRRSAEGALTISRFMPCPTQDCAHARLAFRVVPSPEHVGRRSTISSPGSHDCSRCYPSRLASNHSLLCHLAPYLRTTLGLGSKSNQVRDPQPRPALAVSTADPHPRGCGPRVQGRCRARSLRCLALGLKALPALRTSMQRVAEKCREDQ